MTAASTKIKCVENCSPTSIPDAVFESTQPILLKGLVDHWPAVQLGRKSTQDAADYLLGFDQQRPLTSYEVPAGLGGRIFYNEDFTGFNFSRTRRTLAQVLSQLFTAAGTDNPPSYYVGSTMVDHWLPGFRDDNDLNLGDRECLVSIWLGNQTRVAAHYDFPNNIACSVVGRRKVTLFPPDQAENLYVGPLEFTPSGQPISLVDSSEPDFERFPKYKNALAAAIEVELEAGDAIFIPSMWWHHIEALEKFNVLVNYWWRVTPAYLGSPLNALHHAVMSLSDLPLEQRSIWKQIFDTYVFNKNETDFEHIPESARGILSNVDEQSARAIRDQLLKFLK